MQPVDIKSRWRHNWKSAQVVNSHLVCDPTIRQPGFDLLQQQWSLLNRFHTEQTLRCLQKEMATYRHRSVSFWWDPDDVPHYRILSPDNTEWQLISATLCGRRCCFVADQLSFMTRIREEEECMLNHWFNITVNNMCKQLYKLHDLTIIFHGSPWPMLFSKTFQDWKMVLINSMTFHDWGYPVFYSLQVCRR